jgi:ComF family protein
MAVLDLLRASFTFIFPNRCAGCSRRGAIVCSECEPSIPWLGSDVCPTCALPTRLARICRECRAEPGPLDGVRAACRFEGIARSVVHDLKFRGLRDRAPLLGDWVVDAVERRPLAVDLLVPIPLALGRRRERGFNQSALIASQVGVRIGVPVVEAGLERARETPPQVRRSRNERRENLLGAFRCPEPSLVQGCRVGLVDDVMTTGATLRIAADVLKQHGAARVYGLTVTRAFAEGMRDQPVG